MHPRDLWESRRCSTICCIVVLPKKQEDLPRSDQVCVFEQKRGFRNGQAWITSSEAYLVTLHLVTATSNSWLSTWSFFSSSAIRRSSVQPQSHDHGLETSREWASNDSRLEQQTVSSQLFLFRWFTITSSLPLLRFVIKFQVSCSHTVLDSTHKMTLRYRVPFSTSQPLEHSSPSCLSRPVVAATAGNHSKPPTHSPPFRPTRHYTS